MITHDLRLLEELGASKRLLQHATMVGDVALELVEGCATLGIELDREAVVRGAVLHDAGKIVVPAELAGPGHLHEKLGEELLLEHGVAPDLARFARTHADWNQPERTLEDLAVTLADKIWKGKRESDLETRFTEMAAERAGIDFWALFTPLDRFIEQIADLGAARLLETKAF